MAPIDTTPPNSPSGPDDGGSGLARVHRLATELAARMRYAQIVERPLPPEQITALVEAARLLQERGEPWPEIVGEVLRHVADDLTAEPVEDPPEQAETGRIVAGLNRFLGAFRRPSSEP